MSSLRVQDESLRLAGQLTEEIFKMAPELSKSVYPKAHQAKARKLAMEQMAGWLEAALSAFAQVVIDEQELAQDTIAI